MKSKKSSIKGGNKMIIYPTISKVMLFNRNIVGWQQDSLKMYFILDTSKNRNASTSDLQILMNTYEMNTSNGGSAIIK